MMIRGIGQGLTVRWRLKPLPHHRQSLRASISAGCPRAAGWHAREIVRLHRARLEAEGLLRVRTERHLRRAGLLQK